MDSRKLREIHKLFGDPDAAWYGWALQCQAVIGAVTGGIFFSPAEVVMFGGDPISWALLLRMITKRSKGTKVVLVVPSKFMGTPVHALKSESFFHEFRKVAPEMSEMNKVHIWFERISSICEQNDISVDLYKDQSFSLLNTEGENMIVLDKVNSSQQIEFQIVTASPNSDSSTFFDYSKNEYLCLEEKFVDCFNRVIKTPKTEGRYATCYLADQIYNFSLDRSLLNLGSYGNVDSILNSNFSNSDLGTISKATEAWKLDLASLAPGSY